MKISHKINWIFFDMGGVLVDNSKYEKRRMDLIFRAVSKHRPDITRKEVLQSRYKASSQLGNLTEDIISLLLKYEKEINDAIQYLEECWGEEIHESARGGLKEVIEKLSKKYKLGILANQPRKNLKILDDADLLQYFSFQNVSEDFNLRKPDPDFFKAVFKVTHADPKKSVMIDDNIERGLLPAKKFGMTTIWYKLEERKIIKGVDFVITNLEDLLEIF